MKLSLFVVIFFYLGLVRPRFGDCFGIFDNFNYGGKLHLENFTFYYQFNYFFFPN